VVDRNWFCVDVWVRLGNKKFCNVFSSLFAKTWRIYKIFSSSLKMVHKRVISNDKLLVFIGICLAIEIVKNFKLKFCDIVKVLLILWTCIDPLREHVIMVDPYRPSLNYSTCSTGTGGYVLLALLALFKVEFMVIYGNAFQVILLIAGAYVSYKIKNVEMSLYNDSKIIGFSVRI
jgi:hypothetical protein